ncbi:MAG: hypothetical protein KBE65_19725 [Phycisphaerae bacterium]|nr:hypothetical protein [Phycisphaerae bacterium]
MFMVVWLIPTIATASTYVPLGDGVSHAYMGIPFEEWGVWLYAVHTVDPDEFIPSATLDLSSSGAPQTLHMMQYCAWADNVPDGAPAGRVTVFYDDGSQSSVDLIVGVNTAEWAYDRPEMAPYLQHTKVTPGFSFNEDEGSAEVYDGHHFYAAVPLAAKPLAYLELTLDPASYTDQTYYGYASPDWFGLAIVAVTLEYPPDDWGCVVFEDHFNDNAIDPAWNTFFSTSGFVLEKNSDKYGESMIIVADGTDIWTDNDEYGSVYMPVDGDFDAIVEMQGQYSADMDELNEWAKAGIAVRNDMTQPGTPEAPGSVGYAAILVTPGNGYAFQWDGWECSTTVPALRRNPNFPDTPDLVEMLSEFKTPVDWGDCYGQRVSGLIQPPEPPADSTGPLVLLLAEDLPPAGSLVTEWPNRGTLGGVFKAIGNISVKKIKDSVDIGFKAAVFDGSAYFEGPISSPCIEGGSSRTIIVRAFNWDIGGAEPLVTWGHLGGPSGTYMGFNYGSSAAGAVSHWDDAWEPPFFWDMGWEGPHAPAPEANRWWLLDYNYDGVTATAGVVDIQTQMHTQESIRSPISLNTYGGTPIRIAAIPDNTGEGVEGGFFSGAISQVMIDGKCEPGYFFRIASDDSSELWLSTDENPDNRQLIASVEGWTPADEYGWFPSQQSAPIEMDPAKKYYVEALHKEGSQGDHLTVQWRGPGFGWQTIQGEFTRQVWTTGWGPDGFLDSWTGSGGGSYPCWLKLQKRGTTVSGYYATNGPTGNWIYVGGATLDDAGTYQHVGMIATSHEPERQSWNAFEYFALLRHDTTPPDLWLEVSPTVLWPPNHKMVLIKSEWTVWDEVDPSPVVTLKSITMYEGDKLRKKYTPDKDNGSGNTTDDIYVDPKGRIFLRAERSGTSCDRVYTLLYEAVDFCGNARTASALVVVPHDQVPKPADVTAPGDAIRGVPNDGDWPDAEAPANAIDNDVDTKYLHFKGAMQPTGFQVQPASGPTIIHEMTFTTANDATERDPVQFEVYGATEGIDGPYTLIASGDITDFAGPVEWPRLTPNSTPITFPNETAYRYYQVLFPAVRDPASANSMQIAEVELIGVPAP